jgi:hypothetical protein
MIRAVKIVTLPTKTLAHIWETNLVLLYFLRYGDYPPEQGLPNPKKPK